MSTLSHNSSVDSPAAVLPQSPTPKRWTREEYYRLSEGGWFQDQRVELIDGEIIVLTPQSTWHAFAVGQTLDLLNPIFADGYWVRSQLPLHAGQEAEPEPDISVVQGAPKDYLEEHPDTAVLIVEVSYSSQDYDMQTKAHLYASMNIPDYWVLDVENRQLTVYRSPIADEEAQFGARYEEVTTLSEEQKITPLEQTESTLLVAGMLPPQRQT